MSEGSAMKMLKVAGVLALGFLLTHVIHRSIGIIERFWPSVASFDDDLLPLEAILGFGVAIPIISILARMMERR